MKIYDAGKIMRVNISHHNLCVTRDRRCRWESFQHPYCHEPDLPLRQEAVEHLTPSYR